MIKTEFCNHDFHEGDRVVLVNDDLQIGDCDRHLVPGVEGTVLDFFPAFSVPIGANAPEERIQICWDGRVASHLKHWWVNPSDIAPVDNSVSVDVSPLL